MKSTLTALVLSSLIAAPAYTAPEKKQDEGTYDYEASQVKSLKQLEECTYRVNIQHVYSINGKYELIKRGQASLATIGQDKEHVYFLTNAHVVDHDVPETLLKENIAEIRGAMGEKNMNAPASTIFLTFIRTHAKLTDAKDVELPDVDLDLLIDDASRDMALLSVPRSALSKYTLCPELGDSDLLERGNVLYAFGYGKGDALMTRGIYSGIIISPKTNKPLKLMDGSITNGYSGSGVYALKNGKPFYVGLPSAVVYDNPKYGGFISSNSIRTWLEVHDKGHILVTSPEKK